MNLELKIKADFNEASRQFKALSDTSEETKEKLEKFAEGFKDKHVDDFINKQKLAQAALTGTRGETAAMQASVNNYQKEIERLINKGLDPNSDAVQKLAREQEALKKKIKEANEVQKMQADLMKVAEKAAIACYAAIAAGAAAVIAMTHKTAEMGDEFAKTSRKLGMTAETFQELQYAASQNGIKDITPHLQKLNKAVGDAKNGTGTLTSYLKDNNEQLLSQIKNAKSNEEAFNLLMGEINKAPDQFTKAQLATAAFGKAGLDMINMANDGVEGLADLREEARKYGVMSNEAAEASERYMDAQTRLQAALTGVQMQLTGGLLPGITNIVNKLADFIASVDDWDRVLRIVGYTLAGVTAGLTTFMIVTKGAAAIKTLVKAFKALNAAMAANPIGAIAVLITAVLVPALIYLVENWDYVTTYFDQGLARLKFAFKFLTDSISGGFTGMFDFIKIAYTKWLGWWFDIVTFQVRKTLELLNKIPVKAIQDATNTALNGIQTVRNGFTELNNKAIASSSDATKATLAALNAELGAVDRKAEARRAELNDLKNKAATEAGIINDRRDTEIAAYEAVTNAAEENAKKQKEIVYTTEQIWEAKMSAISQSLSGFSDLLSVVGEKSREAAVIGKAVARVEAGFNTYAAFTRALNNPVPMPTLARAAQAAGILASGLAAQMKISQMQIPSAETGGRFIVPDVSPRVDGALLRVNSGEPVEVNVTPRGETPNTGTKIYQLVFNGQVLADAINNLARSGELHTLQLAGNL